MFPTGVLQYSIDFYYFSAQNLPKPLELGPTKVRNVFSTLKIGGWHVGTPRNPLFVTWKPSCGVLREARPLVHMAPTCAHLGTYQTGAFNRVFWGAPTPL